MNFEKKEEFIYFGRKNFCRKVDIHIIIIIIGRKSNLSLLPDSQIYLYYLLHLWSFNRTPPIWWCSWRFFAHHKLDIKNVSAIIAETFLKGRHQEDIKKPEGSWFPIGDFRHLRYQFFLFLNFLTLCKTNYILLRIFPEVRTW